MRRSRWPALPALLLCAACATQAPRGDHWGVRRIAGADPALVSLSEVNPGRTAATQPLQPVLLRVVTRGADALANGAVGERDVAESAAGARAVGLPAVGLPAVGQPAVGQPAVMAHPVAEHVVSVHVDAPLAEAWLPFADRIEPELQRALDWLAAAGADAERDVQLQVTLVDEDHHRREARRHPAADAVWIDLLVPAARQPASRSATVARALAIALHEAVHALRGDDTTRAADEYRASLVESCYLLDVARAGDVIDLDGVESGDQAADDPDTDDAGTDEPNAGDFTARHSREAAARVLSDLRRAAGSARIGPADIDALRRVRAFCRQRLQMPPRR